MDEEKEIKLSKLALKLSSLTFVLNGRCTNYDGESVCSSNLIEFTKILHETSEELFDLL